MFHTKDTPCFPEVIDAISRRADFQHLDCIPPESAWIGNLKRSVPVTGTRRTTRAAVGTLRAVFGPDEQLLAGVVAALVESTRGELKFTARLSAITAAVVGGILNLALFFGYHVLWPQGFAGR